MVPGWPHSLSLRHRMKSIKHPLSYISLQMHTLLYYLPSDINFISEISNWSKQRNLPGMYESWKRIGFMLLILFIQSFIFFIFEELIWRTNSIIYNCILLFQSPSYIKVRRKSDVERHFHMEQRRVMHLSSEQKRRGNINVIFFTLQIINRIFSNTEEILPGSS